MENQSGEIQMETTSVVIEVESSSTSTSYYESTELAEWEESDDNEAHEEDDYHVDPTWMTSMEKKLVAPPKIIKVSSSTSIHRVPPKLYQLDKNAYVPRVVSIGPLHYHKRKGQLKAMEEHKWKILNEMVTRKGKVWFEQCIVAVKHLEKEARYCYSQVIELNSNSFVEMMLLDGCFLIQLFFKFGQDVDDPILQLPWLENDLTIDLVMLENQIPFFVLQKLCDLMDISRSSLKVAAFNFFYPWTRFDNILPKIERTGSSNFPIHHLLHLLHENIVLSTEKDYPVAHDSVSIKCASKLRESGIKFKKRDDGAGNFLDIKFDKGKGIIEIPCLNVYDETNSTFRNLIAFEQCYRYCERKYITTYTYFIDLLINNAKDVEILVEKEIIQHELGTDEDVASLFNKMHEEVRVYDESFYLLGVCEEINRYCDTTWPKLRATLMHDYFKNPWAIISFIAAVLLLLLTMIQAFFSVFPKFAVGN